MRGTASRAANISNSLSVKNVLFVTDIFGGNGHLAKYVEKCAAGGLKVQIIDPYAGAHFSFEDEQQAYTYFTQHCGHDAYCQLVKQTITGLTDATVVIGFSAGASAVWRAVSHRTIQVKQFIGFYPGQVRHHLDLIPQCPVQLYFPKQEPHFSVDEVMATLLKLENVSCIKTQFEHGFINPKSSGYSVQGTKLLLDGIDKLLIKLP